MIFSQPNIVRTNAAARDILELMTKGEHAKLDAALAALACIEVARVMVAAYAPESRKRILDIVIPFLQSGKEPDELRGLRLS